jgi:hypothetical protein
MLRLIALVDNWMLNIKSKNFFHYIKFMIYLQNVREYLKYIKIDMTDYSWTYQYVDYEQSHMFKIKIKTTYFEDKIVFIFRSKGRG